MEFVVLALTAIVIILLSKLYSFRSSNKKKQQEYQRSIDLQRHKIDLLEQTNSSLQEQSSSYLHEISYLKDALAESERELSFYKNIESESKNLNASSIPVCDFQEGRGLDVEQSAVCTEMVSSSDNFFITGKAGTGKSFLLEAFKNITDKDYIVLAPTGISALNVGGATLHSAFGYYNLVKLDTNNISVATIRLKSEKMLVLKHISTIIIDEISMVRADTFDKIDRILKAINNTDKPFGGKQILLFGDLFQLPPVAQAEEHKYLLDRYGGIHFFCSDAYSQSDFHFRELTINHRQKDDAEYFEILNRVRDGRVSSNDISILNSRIVQDISVYDRFTTLLPTKAEVEKLNRIHIQQLKSAEYVYSAQIVKNKYPEKTHTLETLFPIANTLRLKKGVLVMMVANDPEHRWVNGTLGIVSELSEHSISVAINGYIYEIHPSLFSEPEITYQNNTLNYESILEVMQYPIVPAYAITIHKSQGQTYQNIVCDIDRCFADGQAYVALSRCANLKGLHLVRPVSPASIRVNKSVLDFYRKNILQNNPSP